MWMTCFWLSPYLEARSNLVFITPSKGQYMIVAHGLVELSVPSIIWCFIVSNLMLLSWNCFRVETQDGGDAKVEVSPRDIIYTQSPAPHENEQPKILHKLDLRYGYVQICACHVMYDSCSSVWIVAQQCDLFMWNSYVCWNSFIHLFLIHAWKLLLPLSQFICLTYLFS